MKRILPYFLLTLSACAAPGYHSKKVSAEIVQISAEHDSYDDGRFAFFTVVTYRITNYATPEKTIKRYFEAGSPGLDSLAVGQIVELEIAEKK